MGGAPTPKWYHWFWPTAMSRSFRRVSLRWVFFFPLWGKGSRSTGERGASIVFVMVTGCFRAWQSLDCLTRGMNESRVETDGDSIAGAGKMQRLTLICVGQPAGKGEKTRAKSIGRVCRRGLCFNAFSGLLQSAFSIFGQTEYVKQNQKIWFSVYPSGQYLAHDRRKMLQAANISETLGLDTSRALHSGWPLCERTESLQDVQCQPVVSTRSPMVGALPSP